MHAVIRKWLVLIAATLLPCAAHAAPITFDDLDASSSDIALDAQSPYAGLTWTNFYAYTSVPGFPGFNNGIVSAANAAYSGGEQFGASGVEALPGVVRAAGLMDVKHAYFGSGYYDSLTLTVLGLLDGAQLYSQTLFLSTSGAREFDLLFDGINELRFVASRSLASTDPFACGSFNCTQFTIDDLDLTLRARDTQTVAEPATLALAALLLIALGCTSRRR